MRGSVIVLSSNLWHSFAFNGSAGQLMTSVATEFIVDPVVAVCTVMLVEGVVSFSAPPL